jgi:hypothetical protein
MLSPGSLFVHPKPGPGAQPSFVPQKQLSCQVKNHIQILMASGKIYPFAMCSEWVCVLFSSDPMRFMNGALCFAN